MKRCGSCKFEQKNRSAECHMPLHYVVIEYCHGYSVNNCSAPLRNCSAPPDGGRTGPSSSVVTWRLDGVPRAAGWETLARDLKMDVREAGNHQELVGIASERV